MFAPFAFFYGFTQRKYEQKIDFSAGDYSGFPVVGMAQKTSKEEQRQENSVRLTKETTRQVLQLALAIKKYSQDNKGKMPPMQSPAVFKQALQRYTNKSNFISAASGRPFIPNAKLSGKPVPKAYETIWCYDVKPFSGPIDPKELYRVVGYSDYAIAMLEREWQREKKNAGLPRTTSIH